MTQYGPFGKNQSMVYVSTEEKSFYIDDKRKPIGKNGKRPQMRIIHRRMDFKIDGLSFKATLYRGEIRINDPRIQGGKSDAKSKTLPVFIADAKRWLSDGATVLENLILNYFGSKAIAA